MDVTQKIIPAISIVIPMYNAEKYVGECLDSILAQTFDDYEVIVVDDCSTDNSAAIVESYIPKFGADKLQLVRSKVNSGSGAAPRNIGIRLSRGEYVFLMDNDDAIVENALEYLYVVADKFQADVVHCDKVFVSLTETVKFDKNNVRLLQLSNAIPVLNHSPISNDLIKRIKMFTNNQMRWEPWTNFIRRDFIMRNNLEFPNLMIADDFIFFFYLLLLADVFILVPDAVYIWRRHSNSNFRKSNMTIESRISKRGSDFFNEIAILEDFMNKFELLKNPQNKYLVFEFFTKFGGLEEVFPIYAQIPAFQLDALVRHEISQLKDTTALTAFLFARMNVFNVNLLQQQQLIQQQQQQIQQLQAQLQQLQPAQFQLQTEDIFKH